MTDRADYSDPQALESVTREWIESLDYVLQRAGPERLRAAQRELDIDADKVNPGLT